MLGVDQVADPAEAVDGADIVYTDVWVSMGDEDSEDRREAFAPYQVNAALMAQAPNAHFLHCLPARRGEEVTADVIDGPRSRSGARPRTGCTRRGEPALAVRRCRLNRGKE